MKSTLRTVRLALAEPLRISRSTMAARDAVWLTVEHDGLRGHGEAVTSVYYGLGTETLVRLLTTVDLSRFPDPESALEALRAGQWPAGDLPPAVTAAVESALLDLAGKRAGVPVHRLLGAAAPPVAATARTIGITTPVRAAAQARHLVASGFEIIKVKAGTPDPEDDVERVRANVLEDLAAEGHELPKKILEWRQLSKLKSTYSDALPEHIHPGTRRVHTSYSLASTSTGRLSSTDPNLQNIPIRTEAGRKIRKAFVAPPGRKLISAD